MATFSNTPRPAYVYEAATDQWIPVGFGPHTHAVTDVTNAFNTTTVTTKGDLVVAAGSNNITRLAAGTNGDTLVPDSSTATGLRWQGSMAAGRNAVINGGFDIWQRGTTFTNPSSNTYGPDRWTIGDNSGCVYTRQSTDAPTGIQYFLRAFRTAGTTSTSNINVVQSIDTINSIPLAGKTVTLSMYLRKGANGPSNLNIALVWGTNTDGSLWAGGGNGGTIAGASQVITTSWTRYSYTATVPSNATQLFVWAYYSATGTAPANEYYDITGVQLEVGSVATNFSRAGGTIQGELAACQRYYYRATVDTFNKPFAMGQCYSTTQAYGIVPFPVTMRTLPSALEQSGSASDYKLTTSNFGGSTCTAVPTFNAATQNASTVVFTASAVFTAGHATSFLSSASGSYLGWSAEL
jgi:hypothetical protein